MHHPHRHARTGLAPCLLHHRILSFLSGFSALLLSLSVTAAGNSLVNPDSNSRVVVENAVVRGGDTELLFWTYPDIRDPNAGKPCPLNFYTLKLRPGLPAASPALAAANVCGNGLSRAGLLSNGDVVIIAGDRLERWHAGKQRSSQPLDSVQATQGLGVDTASDGQIYDFANAKPAARVALGTFSCVSQATARCVLKSR